MTQKYKVLVTRKWPKKVEEELQLNYEATLNESDTPLSEKELIEAMQNHDALLPTVTDKISDTILSTENKKVKIVGNFGVGFNNIDIDSAKKNNLVVTNTPEVLTDCTADIAMLLMLGVARRGSEGEFHVRKKEWSGWRPTHMMGTKITDKTITYKGKRRPYTIRKTYKINRYSETDTITGRDLFRDKAMTCKSYSDQLLTKRRDLFYLQKETQKKF